MFQSTSGIVLIQNNVSHPGAEHKAAQFTGNKPTNKHTKTQLNILADIPLTLPSVL